jgi:AraC family transcriptional regulator of adaptative response / DNA-3-methyladenine glycosylase II
VTFYATAAAAQHDGFRACKRCRPDATPGSPEWDTRADVAARAMRLIAEGVVDHEGIGGLSSRLGYSRRQLERVLQAELGAGPLAIARAQRAQTARVLIETTVLPFGEIAFASGFSSIRQFNDTVREVFATAPTALRIRSRRRSSPPQAGMSLFLRLPFRSPLCPDNLFGHLAATAVPGCEEASDGTYRRSLRLPHGPGVVALRPAPDHVACHLRLTDLRDLTTAISRCRRLLDLDADPTAVDELLSNDAALAPVISKAPGRRIPRTVDGGELALRAVLGQQISTAAARTHAARLVARDGDALPAELATGTITHLFPLPEAIDPRSTAVPAARVRTLVGLRDALVSGDLDLEPGADWTEARSVMAGIPGMGPWTIETVAMRALGDPDAFLGGDLGVRRAATGLGLPDAPAALLAHAGRWRPWRSYAVQYLWSTVDHPINRFPTSRLFSNPEAHR